MTEPQTKICSQCKTEQPITEFGLNPCDHTPTTRSVWCYACRRDYGRKRHYTRLALIATISRQHSGHNARLKMRRARYGRSAG